MQFNTGVSERFFSMYGKIRNFSEFLSYTGTGKIAKFLFFCQLFGKNIIDQVKIMLRCLGLWFSKAKKHGFSRFWNGSNLKAFRIFSNIPFDLSYKDLCLLFFCMGSDTQKSLFLRFFVYLPVVLNILIFFTKAIISQISCQTYNQFQVKVQVVKVLLVATLLRADTLIKVTYNIQNYKSSPSIVDVEKYIW